MGSIEPKEVVMAFVQLQYLDVRPIALIAGAEGNLPALKACLLQARRQSARIRLFLGNGLGAFGHSNEALFLLQTQCTWLVKGSHERQLLNEYSGQTTLFNTTSAMARARQSLSPANKKHLKLWTDVIRLETPSGAILACHGTPDFFLPDTLNAYNLDRERILYWLDQFHCQGLVVGSDHQPWIEHLPGSRFVASCGTCGFASQPDSSHVHYLLVEQFRNRLVPRVERVDYNIHSWISQLRKEGVPEILTYPLLKGLPPPDDHYS
jgi:hypothetical protein